MIKTEKGKICLTVAQSVFVALFYRIPFITYGNQKGTILDGLEGFVSNYSVNDALFFLLVCVLILFACKRKALPSNRDTVLAVLFAIFWIMGRWHSADSHVMCVQNLMRIMLCILALTLLFRYLVALLNQLLSGVPDMAHVEKEPLILGKHALTRVAIILFLSWLPIMILSYPGSLAGDTLFQIWQIDGTRAYWAHTPLFHTLCLGAFLRFGEFVFHDMAVGFFLNVIAQGVFMAAILGYSLQRLYERDCNLVIRRIVFSLYLLTPTYSNMVTTPGKDLAFMGLFLWYMLLTEKVIHSYTHDEESKLTPFFWILFVLAQVCTALVRKNGIYVIVPTGVFIAVLFWKRKGKKTFLFLLLLCAILPFAGNKLTQVCMEKITNAEKASIREALSIPFQQTAFYVKNYGDSLSSFEKEAIDNVLTDAYLIGRTYTPDISDPVKALYDQEASMADLINYFKAWAIGLIKHPYAYLRAFDQHVYGWFYPGADNVIRYDVTPENPEVFQLSPFLLNSHITLKRLYEMNGKIPFLSLLENMGLFVWALFYLLFFRAKTRQKILLFPLFLSVLICMASPAFFENPRYGYPILVSLPFIFSLVITKVDQGKEESKNEEE